jgi:hypothetical protein
VLLSASRAAANTLGASPAADSFVRACRKHTERLPIASAPFAIFDARLGSATLIFRRSSPLFWPPDLAT